MEFKHSTTYPASFEKVVSANFSEEFLSGLTDIPDVAVPVRTDFSEDDTTIKSVVSWEYTGQLDPMARALLKNKPLTWVQTTTIDKAAKTGVVDTVYMEGSIPGSCEATVTYTENSDGTTTRELDGKIFVKIPVVGGQVEKRLVEGIEFRLDEEAKRLITYLENN